MLSFKELQRVIMKSPVPTQFQRVFIHFSEKPDGAKISELQSMGVMVYEDSWIPPIPGHSTGFIVADIPIDRVLNIANLNYVQSLNSAEILNKPLNNIGAQVIGASDVWLKGYSGYGVTVAVLDSGLEYTSSTNKHGDLPDSVIKIDYSAWPSKDSDVRNLITGHGTHVTGTVLGSGLLSMGNTGNSGGPYKGMAYNADLVFLKIGDDISANASSAAVVNALKDAAEIYGADIINMSYGGWGNYNDGSDEIDQAADYAYMLGSAVFFSEGNEADKGWHYYGTVPASGSTGCIKINLSNHDPGSSYFYVNLLWYDGYPTSKDLYLMFYSDPSCSVEVQKTDYAQTQSLRGTESRLYRQPSSPNYFAGTEADRYIKVFNNSASNQSFHLYLFPQNLDAVFQSPNINYTLVSPATADYAMAVASYVSRASWTDYQGNSWCYILTGCDGTGGISSFSSRGPRVNGGIIKPNLTAPGQGIISLRDHDIIADSSFIIDNNGLNLNGSGPADYLLAQGTSMASPMAAGATALLMDSYPYLRGNPLVLYSILQSTTDDIVSGTNADGNGLINIFNAYNILVENVYKGDFNGDGKDDIMTVNPSGGAVMRLSTGGSGAWTGWTNVWAA